jgi:poly(3-hydroxybutyrate) depolymerase
VTITVEDDRTVYPARVDLKSGAITRAVAAGAFVGSALPRQEAIRHSSSRRTTRFAEVYALEGRQLRKLTAQNDEFLSELALGAVEDFQFKSKDGTEIHGLIVKPPLYVPGRKYPTLLWIHGGPNGQDEHSLVLDCYQSEPQMFAARGFVVVQVNYRGGTGRGIADFAKAIFADWGHKEVEDLLAGVDHLVAVGIADKERLAIGGWSYGAILTDYTIATDHRFKVAISGAGSGNQLSTYGVMTTFSSTRTSSVRRGVTRRCGSRCHIRFSTQTGFIRRLYSWAATRTSTFRSSAVSRCTRRCAPWVCRLSSCLPGRASRILATDVFERSCRAHVRLDRPLHRALMANWAGRAAALPLMRLTHLEGLPT